MHNHTDHVVGISSVVHHTFHSIYVGFGYFTIQNHLLLFFLPFQIDIRKIRRMTVCCQGE